MKGSCKTVTSKSTLTYEISKGSVRIESNTGGGLFSKEWVSLAVLEKALAKTAFTSANIKPLLKGKSQNTAGFIIAILLHEGIITRKERHYVWVIPKKSTTS